MRILGSKSSKVSRLIALMRENIPDFELLAHQGFHDVMAGIGTVSQEMLRYGNVYANDLFYPFHLITQFQLQVNVDLYELNLLRQELNDVEGKLNEFGKFFTKSYGQITPYFTKSNAKRIALMRQKIEEWYNSKQIDLVMYENLLGMLLSQVLHIASIRLTFDAPIKLVGVSLNHFQLPKVNPISARGHRRSTSKEYREVLGEKCGILYLDPPFNQKQYGVYYHLLETLYEQRIGTLIQPSGKLFEYTKKSFKSNWCKTGKVWSEFNYAIQHANADVIAMTYSNKGLLKSDQIEEVFKRNGSGHTYQTFDLGSETLYLIQR